MENINQYGIILDGKMDEPVWDTVKEYTGFRKPVYNGGEMWEDAAQTSFKILPCGDRIYVGVKCKEPDMEFAEKTKNLWNSWGATSIEMFFSPSGNPIEFYQFFIALNGNMDCLYYAEGGQIQPDPYAPQWNRAVYSGEDYWSMEVEIPLSAFYMTPNTCWSDSWLVNMCRTRYYKADNGYGYEGILGTWCPTQKGFIEPQSFATIEGLPVRKDEDDVYMSSAEVDLTDKTDDGYRGTMTVKVNLAAGGEFTFSSPDAETVTVNLPAGSCEFTAPCFFAELGRPKVTLTLRRESTGAVYSRRYPVLVTFEPVKIKFTLPEYRNNFYPGQDYTKIVGTAKSAKPITLTLEGPGIPAKTITPNADGSFVFDTPNFQEGEAWLTATAGGYEVKKMIRRLAPTGHTMAWISGGNLVLNGKPVLRRNFYGPYYRGGEQFNAKYAVDDLSETRDFDVYYRLQPEVLVPGSGNPGGEVYKDQMPSEAMLRAVDAVIEAHKDEDFTHYYIADEPDCRNVSEVYLQNLYEYAAQKDPYHLILVATRAPSRYVRIADWLETHPYIDPYYRPDGTRTYGRDINAVGAFVEDLAKLNLPDKCIGFLYTCFAYKMVSANSDYPTFEELLAHTWAAMIRGGKSLWPYAYHDVNDRPALYEGTRYIFSSFEALEDMVLFGKRTTLHRTPEAEAVLYEHGNEKMFVLVNLKPYAQKVTLEGISGTWHEFRHDRAITDNAFDLKPFEVVIGTTAVLDAGIPTYQQTEEKINKLEYERTHRGSLLFGCEEKVKVTTSAPVHVYNYKMFDGMRDNDGVIFVRGEKYYEVEMTDVKPTFSKVVIYGNNVDDTKLFVRNGGELSEPAIAEIKREQYSTTFCLKEAICPEALRLEFYNDPVELYELEVF